MAGKSDSLKIGLVLDDGLDKPDGVQQYVLGIGGWLTAQGHTVHYLVGETHRTDIANVHSLSKNLAVRFNGNRLNTPLPASRRRLKRLVADEAFDVLHVQVPYSPFMAQRLLRFTGKHTAVIGTFHIAPADGIVTIGTQLLGLWLKPTLRRFDRMLSVSTAAQEFSTKTFKVGSTILPNVIDYVLFHDAKPLDAYTDSTPTILFLGRLVPRKGCMLLLQAITLLRTTQPDLAFRVLICGKGPLLAELQQYVQLNALQNCVEFVGFVSEADKPRYYASADIAVFPSSGGESFGIVLLEAMASGKAAVLAGDNPGYRSVMEPKLELLFDPHNPSQLAEKIAQLICEPAKRRQAATWGRTYTEQFDTNVVGRQLEHIYRQALRKRLTM